MKKLFVLFLILASSLGLSAQKKYVVIMKDGFEAPVLRKRTVNADREQQNIGNKPERDRKISRIDGFAKTKRIAASYRYTDAKVGFDADLTPDQAKELSKDPDVEGVYEDFEMQGKPIQQGQPIQQGSPIQQSWNYNETTKSSCAVNLVGGSVNSSNRKEAIWIMDTGIDKNHPDLKVNSRGNIPVSFIPGESPTEDYAGHGTHCAGIAAGKEVGKMGCNGVSSGAEVIPVKVLDRKGVGSWTNILKGIDHIARYGQPGDVVMMSLGEYDVTSCENSNPSLYSAIRELAARGFFIVMSAGNNQGDANLNLPGCISGPNIFTVAALDFNCSGGITGCASYSNYGAPAVDWAAPGSAIISTWPGRQYQVMSGTSMACALVAGIIHARNGAPASNGTLDCNGTVYQIPRR
jgi:hypothetical protein